MPYELHPACAAWPAMTDAEIDALAADIKAKGLLFPGTLHGQLLLDGRNRQFACERAGVPFLTVQYEGDDPVGYSISLNQTRRHLEKHILAFVAEELAKLKIGRPKEKIFASTISSGDARETLEQVGKQLGVGRNNIESARAVKQYGEPNVVEMAKAGKVGLQAAGAFARHTPREKQRTATVEDIRRIGNRIKNGKRGVQKSREKELTILIPRSEVIERLRPLIKRVKVQSKRHAATVSFTELGFIAYELEQLADSWVKNEPESEARPAVVSLNSAKEGG
jgi:hypothetical protein